jgi:hypothetical protein
MFRLIRWGAYALLGYAIYEFWVGLSGSSEPRRIGGRRSSEFSGSQQPGPRMTGPSKGGMNVRTEDSSGGGSSQVTGRGVVP